MSQRNCDGVNMHERLKSSTRALHGRIEQNPVLGRLLASDLQKNELQAILLRYYGFFRPLEERLEARSALPEFRIAITDLTARLRSPSLTLDLRALGVSEQTRASAPLCWHLPRTDSLGAALGVLYVLEGSSLGGMIIRRALLRHPFVKDAELQFFSDRQGKLPQLWRSLLETIQENAHDEVYCDAVVSSAIETFSCLDQWMYGAALQLFRRSV